MSDMFGPVARSSDACHLRQLLLQSLREKSNAVPVLPCIDRQSDEFETDRARSEEHSRRTGGKRTGVCVSFERSKASSIEKDQREREREREKNE